MARTLVGRFIEQGAIVHQVNNDDDDPLSIRELTFLCEKDNKFWHICIENYKINNLVFNKKSSVVVGKKGNRYIGYDYCNIASQDFDQILDEVDNALKGLYWLRESDKKKLSPEAFKRYMMLTTPSDKPIRLSLFIEGYKDSKNFENDFTLDNPILLSYLEFDHRRNIRERLLVQLAIYYCYKHIEQSRLYLCYLRLITSPAHRERTTGYKEIKDYNILNDIRSLNFFCEHSSYERLVAFNCKIASMIAQEYLVLIDEPPLYWGNL